MVPRGARNLYGCLLQIRILALGEVVRVCSDLWMRSSLCAQVSGERLECAAYGNDLCGDIGVGLRELAAGILSGEAGCGEILAALCWAIEFGGGELYVWAAGERGVVAALGWGCA
jgi:hypothetical protein